MQTQTPLFKLNIFENICFFVLFFMAVILNLTRRARAHFLMRPYRHTVNSTIFLIKYGLKYALLAIYIETFLIVTNWKRGPGSMASLLPRVTCHTWKKKHVFWYCTFLSTCNFTSLALEKKVNSLWIKKASFILAISLLVV